MVVRITATCECGHELGFRFVNMPEPGDIEIVLPACESCKADPGWCPHEKVCRDLIAAQDAL